MIRALWAPDVAPAHARGAVDVPAPAGRSPRTLTSATWPLLLAEDRWTVIAERHPEAARWVFREAFARLPLLEAAERNEIILMHRHRPSRPAELVARLAGPAWLKVVGQLRRLPR